MEPAAVSVPILMGESVYNNPAICQILKESGALITVKDAEQIAATCKNWLDNPTQMKRAGSAGKQVISLNSGAIQKTLEVLNSEHYV